jgi:regulator of sirC expression with transglutaminase-like and TPR domain
MSVAESEFRAFRERASRATCLEAAELVARCDRPDYEPEAVERAFVDLEAEARRWVDPDASLRIRAEGLCTCIHDVRGIGGDPDQYYREDNSRIDRVLETGRGIPISLAVIYTELGERLGLDCTGVNFPGHFLVRIRGLRGGAVAGPAAAAGEPLLIDPFAGRLVGPGECDALLRSVLGQDASLQSDHLEPATPLQVLVRMLNNLKQLAIGEGRLDDALRWSGRILMAEPGLIGEHGDRAMLFERAGHIEAAIEALQRLRSGVTDPALQARIRSRIELLRGRDGGGRIVH